MKISKNSVFQITYVLVLSTAITSLVFLVLFGTMFLFEPLLLVFFIANCLANAMFVSAIFRKKSVKFKGAPNGLYS